MPGTDATERTPPRQAARPLDKPRQRGQFPAMSGKTPTEATLELDPLRARDGFADLVEYRLTLWSEGYCELELAVAAKHLNRSGLLHGGVPATLMDAACGYAGCFIATPGRRRRGFTLALNTQFIGAVGAGTTIVCKATKTGGGRSIFFASAEVLSQDGELLARGDAVYKYRGRSGEPEGEPLEG